MIDEKLKLTGFRRLQWWLYAFVFNAGPKRQRHRFTPSELRAYEKLYAGHGIWNRPWWERLVRRFMKGRLIDPNEARVNSVELEVGRLYYNLISLIEPCLVLETGVSQGYSTCCIASALKHLGGQRHIYCVDPAVIPHLWDGSALAHSITWFASYSSEIYDRVKDLEFDVLVIDSEHSYRVAMEEILSFETLLKPGGYIIMHDVLLFDGVGAVAKQVMHNPRFEAVTLPSPRHSGVAIIRKRYNGEPALKFDETFVGTPAIERTAGIPLVWEQ